MLTNTSSQCPTLSTPCTVEKLSVNIKQQEKETRKAIEKPEKYQDYTEEALTRYFENSP